MSYRQSLLRSAHAIAARRGARRSSAWVALRKLLISESRDYSRSGSPRLAWKSGEMVEFLRARTREERAEEWGDIGYYIAQTWGWLWWLYQAITPREIIRQAAAKFESRSQRGKMLQSLPQGTYTSTPVVGGAHHTAAADPGAMNCGRNSLDVHRSGLRHR